MIFIAYFGTFAYYVIVSLIRVALEFLSFGLYLLAWMIETNTKMIVLNCPNYHLWKGKMKDLLFAKKFHIPIFTTRKSDFMSDG